VSTPAHWCRVAQGQCCAGKRQRTLCSVAPVQGWTHPVGCPPVPTLHIISRKNYRIQTIPSTGLHSWQSMRKTPVFAFLPFHDEAYAHVRDTYRPLYTSTKTQQNQIRTQCVAVPLFRVEINPPKTVRKAGKNSALTCPSALAPLATTAVADSAAASFCGTRWESKCACP